THSPVPGKEDALVAEKTEKTGKRFTVDQADGYAKVNYPGAAETFVTPAAGKSPIRIVMRYPFNILRQQNTFYFSQYTGALMKADLYANYTAYDKVPRSNYNLHTGKIGFLGIFGHILYLLAALVAASLPIT